MLKVVSWNIRQGGGRRIRQITDALVSMGGHIIVIGEYRNGGSGQTLRTQLLSHGYRHQLVSDAPAKDNSVLIASKLRFASRPVSPELDYRDNLLIADFEAFTVVGGYWPHKKRHKLFDEVLRVQQDADLPLIVTGDFNAGINGIDQKGSSFWYEDDLLRMQAAGLVDAFRDKHGQKLDYSWYSHQGNGFRYDHTYVDKQLLGVVKDCYYEHSHRVAGLSDHSPMVLELG